MSRPPSFTPEPDSIAGRLSHLCRTKHAAGRGPLSAQEVADMVTELGGVQVTGSYIAQVRAGRRTNPTIDVLRALAKVFNVPVTYFLEDCADAACSAHSVSREDSKSTEVTEAMARLSEPSREALASMARHLRQVESV